VKRAKRGDERAIATLFKQFVPEDEQVVAVDYLGVQGFYGLGTSSFACVMSLWGVKLSSRCEKSRFAGGTGVLKPFRVEGR
jgi:hypothetical protein